MTQSVLDVQSLRKVFRPRGRGQDFIAVDDISFTVPTGGSLAIVGESGSGKTTTARMIVGLEDPTSGRITIEGRDYSRRTHRRCERRTRGGLVQMVFQDPNSSLDPRLSVRSCLTDVIRLHDHLDRRRAQERVEELLDQVALDRKYASSLPSELSGGQRQRVAIARALAARPTVLVLDEAVAALDVSIQAQVIALLDRLRTEHGITYVFVSHDLGVVKRLCDTVVVMRNGMVVERGAVTQVLAGPQHPYTRGLIDSIPRPGWKPQRRALDINGLDPDGA
jgi:ABC-type glutathione transport system ATPase component